MKTFIIEVKLTIILSKSIFKDFLGVTCVSADKNMGGYICETLF